MDARALIARWRGKAEDHAIAAKGPQYSIDDALEACLLNCADELERCLNGAPVRVLRVLEYTGPREWVEDTLSKGAVQGTHRVGPGKSIKSAIIGEFPEILINAPIQKKEGE